MVDAHSSATDVPFRVQPRLRSDLTVIRGDNHRHHLIDKHRANSFSGSSLASHISVLPHSASRHTTQSANPSNHKASSQTKVHRASIPASDQEKLARSLTSLNIATFDPMLPPSLGQRSSTFVGQKRQAVQLRTAHNQYATVSVL